VSEDDPRALATISQHIAQHTRSVITYEELAFEYEGDLQLYPDKNPAHALPQHQRFTFSYDPTVDVEETLEALIASYNAQSSGSYKLVEADGVFHILPDTSKDESGTLTQRASILDLPVSVQLSDETGGEVACEVLRQLKESWDVEAVCLTGIKGEVFGELVYDEYALEAPAREHITRIRQDLSKPLSWHITRSFDGRYGVNFFIQQFEP